MTQVYAFQDKTYADVHALLTDLKWHKFKVLDEGFISLVDMMGNDAAIVQAARVSYGKDLQDERERYEKTLTKLFPNGGVGDYVDRDMNRNWSHEQREAAREVMFKDERTLIRYLMRHRHTSPFEMIEYKFLFHVPMDCWRQVIRHRTANVNEFSTRYSEAIDACQATAFDEWRLQSKSNHQGSEGYLTQWPDGAEDIQDVCGAFPSLKAHPGEFLTSEEEELQKLTRSVYDTRIKMGVAREQARKDLPLSTYTKAYWKIDLHNLFHFLALRLHPHAQLEIRQYAEAISKVVEATMPTAWQAFCDYRLNSTELTVLDTEVINSLAETGLPADVDAFMEHQHLSWRGIKNCRERSECLEKLVRLGLVRI